MYAISVPQIQILFVAIRDFFHHHADMRGQAEVKSGNGRNRITIIHWLAWLSIWWVAAVFSYMFIAASRTDHADDVMQAGLKTVMKSADQAGLPLLERDVQALTRLMQHAAKQKGVLSCAIIDHKNKIIAFSDPEPLLSIPFTSVRYKDGVAYWHHRYAGTPAICFATEITYAGTKIGQVFLAMDADSSNGLVTVFLVLAFVSLLVIVITLLIIEFHGVRPLKTAVSNQIHRWIGGATDRSDGRDVICPLCGQNKPLGRSVMTPPRSDRHARVGQATAQNGSTQTAFSQGIDLRELSRRDDLGWLRKQIIHRCADIIKTLAGD
ncbi:MAG: hypothetical protein CR984_00520 [Proteobacteria bacterium]|nr:MAG: hypothetical protein CR984_00520 [Pseudomonadota bacterium]PIE66981.1 MAG: hypothetical protein CSA23_06220 [Deltaproteobacteria bacterium]